MQKILGETVRRPAMLDQATAKELRECSSDEDSFQVVSGDTMGTDCFYEGTHVRLLFMTSRNVTGPAA